MGDNQIPAEDHDGITVVRLADCILNQMSPEQIGPHIVQLIDHQRDPKLVISFEDVEHLSSASLGMLLLVKNSIDQHGGQMNLCHLNQRIQDLFDLTMLTRRFNLCNQIQDALTSFE